MNLIIFLIILLVLVLVHEFGHFFTAKKFGIRVDEFGFGFPPKIFGFKKGETEYTINALPFGGFVKIFGETPDEAENPSLDTPSTKSDLSRSFAHKPKWQQAIVLLAGIFSNFILAWLLFSFGFMSGLPTSVGSEPAGYTLSNVHLTVVSVLEKSPAQNSGLKSGDKIISVESESSKKNNFDTINEINPDTLKSFILSHSEKNIKIGYIRGKDSEIIYSNLKPELSKTDGKPLIGITMDLIGTAKLPIFRAFWEGLKLDWSVTKDTITGLLGLIKRALIGKGSFGSVTGPVGMVGIVGDAYKFGFTYLLSFAALISVNLAVINLIPFPALDGGRLFFLLIEKIKGSRISPKVANYANMIGFGILILLMLFVTYHDVVKLF